MIEWIPPTLSLFFCFFSALFMVRAAMAADEIKKTKSDIGELSRRFDKLEFEFSDKWDNFVQKTTSRQGMRKKREEEKEAEGLNKPNGGILVG